MNNVKVVGLECEPKSGHGLAFCSRFALGSLLDSLPSVEVIDLELHVVGWALGDHMRAYVDSEDLSMTISRLLPSLNLAVRNETTPSTSQTQQPLAVSPSRTEFCSKALGQMFQGLGVGKNGRSRCVAPRVMCQVLFNQDALQRPRVTRSKELRAGAKRLTSASGYCEATSIAQSPGPQPQSRILLGDLMGGNIRRLSKSLSSTPCIISRREISS